MRIIGKGKLQRQLSSDELACTWIRAWVAELAYANWKRPEDVRNQFPNVRRSDTNQYIFTINNSTKEVYLKIAFQQGIAVITEVQ